MDENEEKARAWPSLGKDGVELRDAWFQLADDHMRNRLRSANLTPGKVHPIEREMKDQLQWQLEDGSTWEARGIWHGEKALAGMQPIPSIFFDENAEIDWPSCTLRAYGHTIGALKIFETGTPDTPRAAEKPKKRMGRPPVLPALCAVVRELENARSFDGLTQKAIQNVIRKAARNSYPRLFPGPAQPSKDSIDKALRLEGLKPAQSEKK